MAASQGVKPRPLSIVSTTNLLGDGVLLGASMPRLGLNLQGQGQFAVSCDDST